MDNKQKIPIWGKEKGRKIAIRGTDVVHPSQWVSGEHPGTCQVPYILNPRSLSHHENLAIRRIWRSSDYSGKNFSLFNITDVPSKYKLAQVLACGLKATNATYSQHWEGLYFDWTFNERMKAIVNEFKLFRQGERFVDNAFATIVLLNTGYSGPFMQMLNLRRKPMPPSMLTLEQIDMGTFEHNIRAAIGGVLGGAIGANVIRHSLARECIEGLNKDAYLELRRNLILEAREGNPGMNERGRVAVIIQIGFKGPEDRFTFSEHLMKLAAAKIIERKSERRNVDFDRDLDVTVLFNFKRTINNLFVRDGLEKIVKMIEVEGNTEQGRTVLNRIRDRIEEGLSKAHDDILESYEDNLRDGLIGPGRDGYNQMAGLVVGLGKKVLKPREDAHKMFFFYIDLDMLAKTALPIDMIEHSIGEAIQAGLNSIHLDGTTLVPTGEDLRFGAFCLTGPLHSAECNDSVEELERGYGKGFWDILAPDLPPVNKMVAIIALAAKSEQDAMISEEQAMSERKSVNDVFWYKTWNHPEGKKLDVRQWISYADMLNVVPIPGNDTALSDDPVPDILPADHPNTMVYSSLKRKDA
ncbi:MAG: hypothetical protein EPN93_02660 [Spirochaetes bacterium]|nr:MAG: hypothetical protein EPN93_02660 [Spirochaetota bacterium]